MLDLYNLTKDEIDQLGNDQLDALVAKHVMGLRVRERSSGDAEYFSHYEEDEFDEVSMVWKRVPRYSKDMEEAWKIVEQMANQGYDVQIGYDDYPGHWHVTFKKRVGPRRFAARGGAVDKKSAARAICCAALKAKLKEVRPCEIGRMAR